MNEFQQREKNFNEMNHDWNILSSIKKKNINIIIIIIALKNLGKDFENKNQIDSNSQQQNNFFTKHWNNEREMFHSKNKDFYLKEQQFRRELYFKHQKQQNLSQQWISVSKILLLISYL